MEETRNIKILHDGKAFNHSTFSLKQGKQITYMNLKLSFYSKLLLSLSFKYSNSIKNHAASRHCNVITKLISDNDEW